MSHAPSAAASAADSMEDDIIEDDSSVNFDDALHQAKSTFHAHITSSVDAAAAHSAAFATGASHGARRPTSAQPKIDAATSALLSSLADYNQHLSRRIVPFLDIEGKKEVEAFCVRWSPDQQYLAVGCGDGIIRIYNTKGQLTYQLSAQPNQGLPTTSIRFRPVKIDSKTKNVLISTNADGSVSHWHMTSQKRLYRIEEEHNQVYALDYRPDGEQFATAGRDTTVRIYEESTKTMIRELVGGAFKSTPGHSNRIFGLKFKPDDHNILLSGGWDNTVQFWDLRTGNSIRSIYGPHICGDSLDVSVTGQVLTGSWRPEKALQVWDFGTGKLMKDITWASSMGAVAVTENAMLYAAQFSPDGSLIAAGGTGTKDARIFDCTADFALMGRIRCGDKGIYSLDFASSSRRLVVAGGTDNIAVRDIQDNVAASTTVSHHT